MKLVSFSIKIPPKRFNEFTCYNKPMILYTHRVPNLPSFPFKKQYLTCVNISILYKYCIKMKKKGGTAL